MVHLRTKEPANIVRIPDTHFRIVIPCLKCKKSYQQAIQTIKTQCWHCKDEQLRDITDERDYKVGAMRIPYFLIIQHFVTYDEVIIQVNDNHLAGARLAVEDFHGAFGCDIIDDGKVSVVNPSIGKTIIVNQIRLRKNPWTEAAKGLRRHA